MLTGGDGLRRSFPDRAQVPMISVGASSPPAGLQFSSYWFRIVPTGTVLGQALAERMHSDRVQSPAMIFVNDEYGRAMATAIKAQFEKSGGSFSLVTSFEPGSADLSPVLRRLLAVQQDGVVLVTYPASASSIIAAIPEMAGRSARFYLTPSLRSEVFLQNVIPSQVEGAVGVSAALPADASAFASTFAEGCAEEDLARDFAGRLGRDVGGACARPLRAARRKGGRLPRCLRPARLR